MKKILVAIDGSEYSKKALLKAKEIATVMGSEVAILNVVGPYKSNMYVENIELDEEIGGIALKISDDILNSAKEIFADFKGVVTTSHVSGDAAEKIIMMAEEEDFDLVIMGSRGSGLFTRTLLGSVSNKVVHHVNTSVLIVK